MHLTLKKETTKPTAFNFLQQRERLDRSIGVYNHERPHQALNGAYPGEIYTPSARLYQPPPEPEYPFHDRDLPPDFRTSLILVESVLRAGDGH